MNYHELAIFVAGGAVSLIGVAAAYALHRLPFNWTVGFDARDRIERRVTQAVPTKSDRYEFDFSTSPPRFTDAQTVDIDVLNRRIAAVQTLRDK